MKIEKSLCLSELKKFCLAMCSYIVVQPPFVQFPGVERWIKSAVIIITWMLGLKKRESSFIKSLRKESML